METEPQREPLAEIPLLGGQLTPGIVCVGNTVRRPAKRNAAFVHDLLLFLEDQGFPFAPRFFGRDEQGRDILSYLDGAIWPDSGSKLPDALLEQAARPEGCCPSRTGTTQYHFSGWAPPRSRCRFGTRRLTDGKIGDHFFSLCVDVLALAWLELARLVLLHQVHQA